MVVDRTAAGLSRAREHAGGHPSLQALVGALVRSSASTYVLAVLLLLAGLFLSGYRLAQTIDLNSDEASYAIQSVALHRTGLTRWSGRPFFVHPPLFFLIEGTYFSIRDIGASPLFDRVVNEPIALGQPLLPANAAGSADEMFNAIVAGRRLSVVYAAAIAIALLGLGTYFGSRLAGVLSAVIFVVDPYVVRRNHFNMLEPLVTLFGVLLLLAYYRLVMGTKPVGAQRWHRALLPGVLLGLALLSKELAGLYALGVIVDMLVFRRAWWREVATILLTGLGVYAIFPVWVALNGEIATWWQTRTWLWVRLTGTLSDTGITRPGTTLTRTVNTTLLDYWPSFVILALAGACALLWVVVRLRSDRRDRAAEVVSSFVLGGDAFFFVVWRLGGVLNEQFFYLIMPFSILLIAYTVVRWSRDAYQYLHWMPGGQLAALTVRAAPVIARAVLIGLLVLGAYDGLAWIKRYVLNRDDSYFQIEGYLARTLPPGDAVIGRDVLDVFLLPKNAVYTFSVFPSVPYAPVPMDLVQQRIPYAILADQYLQEGYGGANPNYYQFVQQYGQIVQEFDGRVWKSFAYQIDYNRITSELPLGVDSLASGKTATASSVEGDVPGRFGPQLAFDGLFGTRWSSQANDPQWIAVDLGERQHIGLVELTWEAAYAQEYRVEVSDDAQNWTSVYETTSGRGGFEVARVSAEGRYVRLFMTRRATTFGDSLWEMQIWPSDERRLPPAASPNG